MLYARGDIAEPGLHSAQSSSEHIALKFSVAPVSDSLLKVGPRQADQLTGISYSELIVGLTSPFKQPPFQLGDEAREALRGGVEQTKLVFYISLRDMDQL